MPLTFNHPRTLGATTSDFFVIISNKVYLDCGLICEEAITTLDSPRLIETITKLYDLAYNTQEKFNLTAPAGSRVACFTGLSSGLTQYFGTMNPAGYYSPMTGSLTVMIRADFSNVFATYQ